MKIVSCKIENFGKLHDFTWHFQTGMNQFLQENGWGKTTLASFIKVMFYGFDNDRKKDIASNERKHYQPFQGGIYGGELVFETDHKRYRIERQFFDTASKDVFKLYDASTNLESNDFTSEVGRELFGVDSTTFQNTIYFTQNQKGLDITNDMHAKIGNVSEEAFDLNSYSQAMDELHKQINRYHPTYKRSETSRIQEEIQQLHEKTMHMDFYETKIAENIEKQKQLYANYREIEKQLEHLETCVSKTSQLEKLQVYQKDLEALNKEIEEKERMFAYYEANYQSGFPSLEVVDELQKARIQYENLLNQKPAVLEFNMQEYLDLKQRFEAHPVSLERMEEIQKRYQAMDAKKRAHQNEMLQDQDYAKLEKWNQITKENPGIISDILDAQSKYREHMETLEYLQHPPMLLYKNVWFYCILCMVLDGYLYWQKILSLKLAGIIGAGVLIIFIVLAVLQNKNSKIRIQDEKDAYERFEIYLKKLFLQCNVPFYQTGIEQSLKTLEMELEEYQKLKTAKKSVRNILSDEDLQFEQQVSEYLTLLGYHPEINGCNYCLLECIQDVKQYEQLSLKMKEKVELEKTLQHYEDIFDQFHEGYHLSTSLETLTKVKEDRKQLESLFEMLGFLKQKKEKVQKEMKDLVDDLPEDLNSKSLASLQQEYRLMQDRKEIQMENIFEAKKELEELQEQFRCLTDYKMQEEQLKQELQACLKQYEILTSTETSLALAKENFTKRYLKPLQDSFAKYYDVLEKASSFTYQYDTNLDMKFRMGALSYELDYLSDGYLDLVNFVRRLSLIDQMFQHEKPFLILDDPFVNLDDDKLEMALTLLEELENTYQIIYFTCQSQRAIQGIE